MNTARIALAVLCLGGPRPPARLRRSRKRHPWRHRHPTVRRRRRQRRGRDGRRGLQRRVPTTDTAPAQDATEDLAAVDNGPAAAGLSRRVRVRRTLPGRSLRDGAHPRCDRRAPRQCSRRRQHQLGQSEPDGVRPNPQRKDADPHRAARRASPGMQHPGRRLWRRACTLRKRPGPGPGRRWHDHPSTRPWDRCLWNHIPSMGTAWSSWTALTPFRRAATSTSPVRVAVTSQPST